MAIVDPNVNIAPSYENVQRALQDRAKIALESGGDSGTAIANAIATPFAQQAQAMQQQQAALTKQRQEKLFDLVQNTQQLDIPEGANVQDVISGKVQPTLKPKTHTVTQSDIDEAVKSFGMDEAHKGAFDDLLGHQFNQKDLEMVLQRRANFIHSSGKGNTIPSDFELADGTKVKGSYDKDKKKYYFQNGEEAPDDIRPVDKNEFAISEKQKQYDENKLQQLEKRLDPTQKRAGSLADAQKRLAGIQRLDALFKGYANDLTPQEWEEAALSWASILGAGTGVNSRSQVEALVPSTIRGNIQKEIQWVKNEPTGTKQQEFAKRIQTGMARELVVNKSLIKDSQLKGLSSVQDTIIRNPEKARTMFDNYDLKPEEVIAAYPSFGEKLYPELGPFYASEAEAHKALVDKKIKPGQEIRIKGKRAVID